MKNDSSANNGFLIKDSSESSSGFFKYCSSNHTYINSAGQYARPILKVMIDDVNYDIQYKGPSEDAGGGTPPSGGVVTLINKEMIETQGDASNVTYILKGASNTNRYLLVSEGFDENSKPSWDAYFTSLNFNGVPMQKIVQIA